MIEDVKNRLAQLGYEFKEGDNSALLFCMGKVEEHIKNVCNITEIPEELHYKFIEMVCGEFLNGKLTLGELDGYNAADNRLIKTISEGDTTVTYQDSGTDAYAVMDNFIKGLFGDERDLCCFRKLRW